MNAPPQDAAYRWLLDALAVQWRDAPAGVPTENGSAAFWDAVKTLALQQRVAGPLYDRTLSHPTFFPEVSFARWLRLVHSGNVLRYERRRVEVSRLLKALADAGVRVLLFKGWALAAILYEGDMGRRCADDLDIVVTPDQIGGCQKVLAGLGYVESDVPQLWPGFNMRSHALAYYAPTGRPRLIVDMHARPLKCLDPDVAYELMGRARPVRVGEAEALAPAAEDHLLCLCGHLALNHRREELLFRYHDLAELIHSRAGALDWDTLFRRAMKWRLVTKVQSALNSVAARWPETVPDEVRRKAAALRCAFGERLAHRLASFCADSSLGELTAILAMPMPTGRKLRFTMEQMFPCPAYMRWRYCPKHPALWPLAYVKRIMIGLRALPST